MQLYGGAPCCWSPAWFTWSLSVPARNGNVRHLSPGKWIGPGSTLVRIRGNGRLDRNGAISASLSKVTPTRAMHISSRVLSPQLTGTRGLFGLLGLFSELSNVQVRCAVDPALSGTSDAYV